VPGSPGIIADTTNIGMAFVDTIDLLWQFPVKSLNGEKPDQADLEKLVNATSRITSDSTLKMKGYGYFKF
jgi:hypothetical protein